MNELKVIRYLIETIVRTSDCKFTNDDFDALIWLARKHDEINYVSYDEDGEDE